MKPSEPLWAVYDDGDGTVTEVLHLSGEDGAKDFADYVNADASGCRYTGKAQVISFVPTERAEKAEARVVELETRESHWRKAVSETEDLEERAKRAETHVTKLWKAFSRLHDAAILAHGAADWVCPEDGEAFLRRIKMAGEALKQTTDSVSPMQKEKDE